MVVEAQEATAVGLLIVSCVVLGVLMSINVYFIWLSLREPGQKRDKARHRVHLITCALIGHRPVSRMRVYIAGPLESATVKVGCGRCSEPLYHYNLLERSVYFLE